ncbi:Sushi repeat (SCR repeat) [Popillia japonica]|uniref:Sushi repeat (SCR repeat) n=1 Tax=Popillia japonica TaxID=7064 RepID=A0AAW1IU26_POPJA
MITCPSLPNVAHSVIKVISGFQVESTLTSTEIEISCMPKYHNIKAPCRASRLKCIGGEWIGILPKCVISKECPPPPDVRHGTPFDINAARYEVKLQRYLINMQISYHCMPGYEMRGNEILTCSSGCWTPSEPPTCQSVEEPYIESNASGQIVISLVTGTGVLLLLVVICLVIVCRRRKPLSRAVSIQPSLPRPDLADHAALLHHPDRLALIAFADGMQVGQPVLPTYEEAIRDRVPGCNTSTRIPRPHWPSLVARRSRDRVPGCNTSTRIPRPHWPSLVARRSRNSPNPDSIHVTRQGSFSHQ